MKTSSITAYIQQLCRLGLGGQVIMPELVRVLHELLPSRINCFLYADQQGQLANIYAESSAVFQPGLPSEHEGALVHCLTCQFHKTHCAGLPDKDFFAEALKPFNHHFLLNMPVQGQVGILGAMQLYRCAKEHPSFNLSEQHQLKLLSSDIALGVQSNRNQRGVFAESGDSAMIVCNRAGKVLYMSRLGEDLLFLASHASVSPDRWSWYSDQEAAGLVSYLCQKLIDSNSSTTAAAGTSDVLQNNWGRFCFHVDWLQPIFSQHEQRIGITLQRQVPLALRLAEAIHAMPLSPRQKQVCQLMSYGCSNQSIADRMKLSAYTIADYVKAIYEKLEVHNRDELLDRLKAYKRIEPTLLKIPAKRSFSTICVSKANILD